MCSRLAIRRMLSELAHEGRDQPGCELVDAVVVVAEDRERPVRLVVGDQPRLVAHDPHFRVLDRREAVGDDRHAGDAECHRPERRVVVQRHLQPLVRVLVVHVVDDVHGVDVDVGEPVHHPLVSAEHVVELQELALHRLGRGPDLFAGDLIASAVDRVEQAFREVGPGAEELHLLADHHRRHAAGDGPVVAPGAAHDLVAFELQRAGVDGHPGRKAPEPVRQARGIPDRQVGFRGGTEVVERVEDAEAGLCHQ